MTDAAQADPQPVLFLDMLPDRARGKARDAFFRAARALVAEIAAGADVVAAEEPAEVAGRVQVDLAAEEERFASGPYPWVDERLRPSLDALVAAPSAAHAYAAYVLTRVRQTPEERAAERRAAISAHAKLVGATRPPTQAQVDYLRGLGYAGRVATMAHASEVIDALLRVRAEGEAAEPARSGRA